jgi:hypothetical protein
MLAGLSFVGGEAEGAEWHDLSSINPHSARRAFEPSEEVDSISPQKESAACIVSSLSRISSRLSW